MQVRPATTDDLDWIQKELREFAALMGTTKSVYDDNAPAFIKNLIENHVFLVIPNVGIIAGMLGPHFINPKIRVLSETFWWVAKDSRASGVGTALFEAFVEAGRQHEADWVTVTLEATSPIEDEFLFSRSFRLQEKCFLKEL